MAYCICMAFSYLYFWLVLSPEDVTTVSKFLRDGPFYFWCGEGKIIYISKILPKIDQNIRTKRATQKKHDENFLLTTSQDKLSWHEKRCHDSLSQARVTTVGQSNTVCFKGYKASQKWDSTYCLAKGKSNLEDISAKKCHGTVKLDLSSYEEMQFSESWCGRQLSTFFISSASLGNE